MLKRLSKQSLAVLTLGTLALGGAALAQGPGPGPGRGGKGPMREEMLAKFDANKDGKLDDTERATARAEREKKHQEMMAKFDTNKDGKLDDTERQAAHAERMAERFKALDKDGNGVLSLEEFKAGHPGGRGHGGKGFGHGPGHE